MADLKYYLIAWNSNKSFELIISDGTYRKEPEDDRWRYEGLVYGTAGGWDSATDKFISPKMLDKPRYEYLFDPESLESKHPYFSS